MGEPRVDISGVSDATLAQIVLPSADSKWTIKAYDFTPDVPIAFPKGLEQICSDVVKQIPWRSVFGSDSVVEYSAWAEAYGKLQKHPQCSIR